MDWLPFHLSLAADHTLSVQLRSEQYIADRDKTLADVLGKYDIIALDEYQDADSALEVRLIMQSGTPVVFLGDSNQSVNNFRHQINDSSCDKQFHF